MKSLLLVLCVISALRAQNGDPTAQLLNTLNTASLQLQALGTLTVNNNTFTQLVQVLHQVFWSLADSAVPFYNNQMDIVSDMNRNLARRIVQTNNTMNSIYSSLSSYINAMNNNYILQLSEMSSQLFVFQEDTLNKLTSLGDNLGLFDNSVAPALADLTESLTDATTLADTGSNLVTQAETLVETIPNLINPTKKTVDNVDITDVTLGSTPLAYCKSFVYTFPESHDSLPQVGLAINLKGEQTQPNGNYDLILASTSGTSATIWICDRSMNFFALKPANLFIMVSA